MEYDGRPPRVQVPFGDEARAGDSHVRPSQIGDIGDVESVIL